MLKLVIFIIGLVQLAQSYNLNPNCAKGPEYWCKSIQTANECQAFKHCLQSVWTMHTRYTESIPQDVNGVLNALNPNPCVNCVQCLSAKISDCSYIRLFGDEIEELKKAKLPSRTICHLLKQQCELKEEQTTEESSDDYVDKVSANDNSLPVDLRFKCGLHPRNWCDSLETARRCDAFDDCLLRWKNTPYKYHLTDSVEQSAQSIGEYNDKEIMSQKTCGFCLFIFSKVQNVFQQKSTEEAVKDYLEGACSLLPAKEEVDTCTKTVDEYSDEIFNLVRNNIDAGIICRVLKLCKDSYLESSGSSGHDLLEQLKPIKNIKIKVLNEDQAQIKTPYKPSGFNSEEAVTKMKRTMGVGCELCTIVLNAAKYMAENKVHNEKILGFIENQLCSRLGSLNSTCVDYVKAEGEHLIELLVQAVDPAILCKGMGLCLKVQVSDTLYNEKFYDMNTRNSMNCTLCKMVVSEVKRKLSDNKSEAELINYINSRLCDKIGKSKELCKSLIEAYGPLFLEIIAKDVNPTQVCQMIGLCDAHSEPQPAVPAFPELTAKTSEECVLCEFVFNLLEKYVSQNSSAAEVESWMSYVCETVMPKPIRGECSSFVNTYGPIIIQLFIKGVPADQICQTLRACPKSEDSLLSQALDNKEENNFRDEEHIFKQRSKEFAKELAKEQEKAKQEQIISMMDLKPAKPIIKTGSEVSLIDEDSFNAKNGSTQCSLCIYLAQMVDNLLKENKTEEQVTQELLLACNLFPSKLKDQCSAFITEYGPYIVQLLANELDPETTCVALRLCDKSIEKKSLRSMLTNHHNY